MWGVPFCMKADLFSYENSQNVDASYIFSDNNISMKMAFTDLNKSYHNVNCNNIWH